MAEDERKPVDVIVRDDVLLTLLPQTLGGWCLQIIKGNSAPNATVMLDPGDVERLRQALEEYTIRRPAPTCTKIVEGEPCGAPVVYAEMDCNGAIIARCEGHY